MPPKKKVLGDHQKVGNRLVAPFNRLLGPIQDISWTKDIFPELLWIAILHRAFGDHRTVELVTSLARAARAAIDDGASADAPKLTFATTSDFDLIPDQKRDQVRRELGPSGNVIAEAIACLVAWYPECPLAGLFPADTDAATAASLQQLKSIVSSLYDRRERYPIMVQATAVWLAFDSGKLKVAANLALARFPEIEKYPQTELSQRVGASGSNLTLGARG